VGNLFLVDTALILFASESHVIRVTYCTWRGGSRWRTRGWPTWADPGRYTCMLLWLIIVYLFRNQL